MSDLQCAWLLLLFCAASRANYVLRVVHLALSFQFAVQHDVGIRQCLQDLLHVPVTQGMWEMAGLPFASGGLCLRNAERLRTTAYWASWADTLPMIRPRYPEVADHMVLSLPHGRGGFHSEGAAECRDRLVAAGIDGAALGQARRRKELRYPELTGEHGRARLVVLACETGGRWSDEAR